MAYTQVTLDKKILSPAELISASMSWVCPIAGIYRLSALGGGASGGAILKSTTYGAASGGGGGGFCELEIFLPAGLILTISIGVGGASKVSNSTGVGYAGTSGGNTVITGTGISMSAGGGFAGAYTTVNGATASGGAGGTASGGDLNASGGAGGDALFTTNYGNASGGGASGSPYGTGGRGGHSQRTNGTCATGGGAVGGVAALDITAYAMGPGAGTGGTPTVYTAPGPNRLGVLTNYSADGFLRVETPDATIPQHLSWGFESLYNPFRCLTGGSMAPSAYNSSIYLGMPGPGAGGKGYSTATASMSGNICGGGGGVVSSAGISGGSFMGGGSGGATAGATSATSAAGGPGFVTIERIG